MRNLHKFVWGLAFIAVGVIFALNALEITNIDVFFDGWWTLFIIIPSFVGIFKSGDRSGSLFMLALGVTLLLAAQNVIAYGMIWKLFLPIALIFIGIKIIFGNLSFRKKKSKNEKTTSAIFSDEKSKWDGEVLEDSEFNCVFGDLKIALEKAVIEKDVTLKINAVFGDVRVKLPSDVNVRVNSSVLFGDVVNKRPAEMIAFTSTVTLEISGVFSDIRID
jgi:predicted membrane protein